MSVSRAIRVVAAGVRRKFLVAVGQTVGEGRRVKLASESTVQHCGANEPGIGTAEFGGTAGQECAIILDGTVIEAMKVGTGGVTAGKYVKTTADGITDITVADGTTPTYAAGIAMQTGVVGDFVGVMKPVMTPWGNA